MKILAVVADISRDNLGGAETYFVEVLKRLSLRLQKVTVLVGPDVSIKKEFKSWTNIEVVPVTYPHIHNLYGVFYVLFSLPVALWLAWRNKYDLIWAKQEYPQAQVGAITKLLTGIPLYVTAQNPNLHVEEFIGSKIFAGLLTPVISFAFRRADVVAAVSNYSAGLARKMGGKGVVVIPNGVDLEKYSRRPSSIPNRHKMINLVTVSSLIPRNGIDTLIDACYLLPSKFNWKLTIAGSGPLMGDLQDLVRNHGLMAKIVFLGRVPNDKIPALLSRADIFIRPSRYEGFGNAFLEAMAVEVPVICTPVGGIVDFIKDRSTGLFVSPDDSVGLSKAIQLLASDRVLYSRLRTNARDLVVRKYSWDRIAEQVWSILCQIGK